MDNDTKWKIYSVLVLVWFVIMVIAYNVWPKIVPQENWILDIMFFAVSIFLMIGSVYNAIKSGKEVLKNEK